MREYSELAPNKIFNVGSPGRPLNLGNEMLPDCMLCGPLETPSDQSGSITHSAIVVHGLPTRRVLGPKYAENLPPLPKPEDANDGPIDLASPGLILHHIAAGEFVYDQVEFNAGVTAGGEGQTTWQLVGSDGSQARRLHTREVLKELAKLWSDLTSAISNSNAFVLNIATALDDGLNGPKTSLHERARARGLALRRTELACKLVEIQTKRGPADPIFEAARRALLDGYSALITFPALLEVKSHYLQMLIDHSDFQWQCMDIAKELSGVGASRRELLEMSDETVVLADEIKDLERQAREVHKNVWIQINNSELCDDPTGSKFRAGLEARASLRTEFCPARKLAMLPAGSVRRGIREFVDGRGDIDKDPEARAILTRSILQMKSELKWQRDLTRKALVAVQQALKNVEHELAQGVNPVDPVEPALGRDWFPLCDAKGNAYSDEEKWQIIADELRQMKKYEKSFYRVLDLYRAGLTRSLQLSSHADLVQQAKDTLESAHGYVALQLELVRQWHASLDGVMKYKETPLDQLIQSDSRSKFAELKTDLAYQIFCMDELTYCLTVDAGQFLTAIGQAYMDGSVSEPK